MGRGVSRVTWAARDEEFGTWERENVGTWGRADVPTYQRTEPFTMGGVMYLKTAVLTFR